MTEHQEAGATRKRETTKMDGDSFVRDPNALLDRWERVQANFVDQPREAVEDADRLVADVMAQLSTSFAEQRDRLERHWAGGEEPSTEDLRRALQHYRAFFARLVAV